jgi:hypothetical protein
LWNTNSSFSFWWYYWSLLQATEEYNGTSWTAGSFKYSKKDLAGAGTQTAGLAFGGSTPTPTGATEEYDGTSWTTSPKFKYSKK